MEPDEKTQRSSGRKLYPNSLVPGTPYTELAGGVRAEVVAMIAGTSHPVQAVRVWAFEACSALTRFFQLLHKTKGDSLPLSLPRALAVNTCQSVRIYYNTPVPKSHLLKFIVRANPSCKDRLL